MPSFQSTLPTRGSDDAVTYTPQTLTLSIHAPHEGERRGNLSGTMRDDVLSIHAPHEGERPAPPVDINDLAATFNPRSPRGGATAFHSTALPYCCAFNPRSPRGGATEYTINSAPDTGLSIHAPHEGERRQKLCKLQCMRVFQSTLPTRGSDMSGNIGFQNVELSIHAPHEGERLPTPTI